MSESKEVEDFENLRKVVEAIDSLVEDGQLEAPKKDEVAEELDVPRKTITRWTEGDYNHAVRTAGLIPRKDRNIGDYMVVYDELDNNSEIRITKENIQEKSPVSTLGQIEIKLSHNQARQKIGLEPNRGNPVYPDAFSLGKKLYGEDGINFEHKLREIVLQSLDEKDRVPSKSEISYKISIPDDCEYDDLKKIADSNIEPIYVEGPNSIMSADRENEVVDFWVNEYLEEDWSQYDDAEVDTIMKLRMTEKDISENELNAVANQYSKWMDFDRYQN